MYNRPFLNSINWVLKSTINSKFFSHRAWKKFFYAGFSNRSGAAAVSPGALTTTHYVFWC